MRCPIRAPSGCGARPMRRARRVSNKRHPRPCGSRRAYLTRSVLCAVTSITEHQLTLWEHEEFLSPATTLEIEGETHRVYDQSAVRRIRTIRSLAEDLGVNLPGIGVALHLLDQL